MKGEGRCSGEGGKEGGKEREREKDTSKPPLTPHRLRSRRAEREANVLSLRGGGVEESGSVLEQEKKRLSAREE